MPDAPWIVATVDMGVECKRCGDSYSPRLPIQVYLWTALCNAFFEVHQDCVEEPLRDQTLIGEVGHHE